MGQYEDHHRGDLKGVSICVLAKRRKEGTMKWKTLKKKKEKRCKLRRISEEEEKELL
jgi:hypothetical protein